MIEAWREKEERHHDDLHHLAWNIAAMSGAAFAGKLKPFDQCFRRVATRKPSLEKRIEDGTKLGIPRPPGVPKNAKKSKP